MLRSERGGEKNIHSSVLINYSLDRFSWAYLAFEKKEKKTEFVHERRREKHPKIERATYSS